MSTHEQTGAAGAQPSEEQLRAAYEAELSRVTSADMALQAAASLLNVGAYRLGLIGGRPDGSATGGAPQRDLEQVRDAIDAVRGLLPVIERSRPQETAPLRQALSQLQMAYAQEMSESPPFAPASDVAATAGGSPVAGGTPGEPGTPASDQDAPVGAPTAPAPGQVPADAPRQPPPAQSGAGDQRGPGPAESSGRLWVPGR